MHTPRLKQLALAGIAMAAMAAMAGWQPAAAQEAPGGLEEVVVTAQRKVERMLDVPISMSVMSADVLDERSVQNIGGIAGFVPNIKIYQGVYSTGVSLSIRGGVEVNPATYYDPTVGIYVDGVYIGKAQGALFDLADIDRIEVLRGPQGTLFGRNTFSGAINITSAAPTGVFGGTGKLGFGNYGQRQGRVNLNLPAVGKVSAKLSGMFNRHDGYAKVLQNPFLNVAQAQTAKNADLESLNTKAARGAVRLQATDDLTLDYALDYSIADNTPRAARLNYIAPASLGGFFDPALPGYVGALVNGTYLGFPANLYVLDHYTPYVYATSGSDNQKLFEKSKILGHGFTAAWEAGDVTLKSITSFRRMDFSNAFDLDATPLPLASTFFENHFRQSSQELQAIGTLGPVNYTAGLYYYHEKGRTINFQQFFGNATTTDNRYRWANTAYAAYGQADYVPDILDNRLTVTGGIRYSWERKGLSRGLISRTATSSTTLIPADTGGAFRAAAWTPTAVLKYNVSDAINVYGKYARGFKGGGFNLGTTPVTALLTFAPEFLDSYEVGTKGRFFDNRLQVTAAAFLNKIKDAQVSVFQSSGTLTISVINNAARATVKGFEVESVVQLADWLRVTGALGYTAPRYDHYLSLGIDSGNDTAFTLTPKVTGSLSADATLAKLEWAELHLQLDYQHADAYYTLAFSKRPLSATVTQSAQPTKADQVDQVDVNLRLVDIELGDGKTATVQGWVKNLLNQHSKMGGTDFGPTFGHLANGFYTTPRTYGVDLSIKF